MSTDHQSLDQQRGALTAAGCERVFTDQLSGIRPDRPGLVAMLEYVRSGDTVVVTSLDRLGRSLSGVIRTVETLTESGVLLKSLREGIDYSTATGRMLAGIFAALAGYERELMHERAAAARAAARARGPAYRAPPRLTPAQARQVRAVRAARLNARPRRVLGWRTPAGVADQDVEQHPLRAGEVHALAGVVRRLRGVRGEVDVVPANPSRDGGVGPGPSP